MIARFFDYDPSISGYRWIVLSADAPTLSTQEGGATDEGYSHTYTRWILDSEKGTVTCETVTDARDCDGRIFSESVVVCPVDDLAQVEAYEDGDAEASVSGPLPFRLPAWREKARGCRDYSAEAAGY